MGERGHAFATWYMALGAGKKYVVSLGLALIAILPPVLLSSVLVPRLGGPEQVEISCTPDGWKAYVSADDPRWDVIDAALIATEACDSVFLSV